MTETPDPDLPPDIRVTFRVLPGGGPWVQRLRRLLKTALRRDGLKNMGCEEVPREGAAQQERREAE